MEGLARSLLSLLVPAVLIGVSGCSALDEDPGPPPPVDSGGLVTDTTQAGLERYRAQWDAAGVAAYRFRFRRACECGPEAQGPFEVAVRDGGIEAVRYFGAGDRALGERLGRWTVEALLDLAADAFEGGAALVHVEYDPRLGFPASVFIDYDRRIADEEAAFTVTAFERLDR